MGGCNGILQGKRLAASQVIVLALYRASENDPLGSVFSEIEITILAHRYSPLQFCITGYLDYPDRKRVSTMLCGRAYKKTREGSVSIGPSALRRWLERSRKGRYRLSEAGVREAKRLLGEAM